MNRAPSSSSFCGTLLLPAEEAHPHASISTWTFHRLTESPYSFFCGTLQRLSSSNLSLKMFINPLNPSYDCSLKLSEFFQCPHELFSRGCTGEQGGHHTLLMLSGHTASLPLGTILHWRQNRADWSACSCAQHEGAGSCSLPPSSPHHAGCPPHHFTTVF